MGLASGYEPEGREFESLRAHHSSPCTSSTLLRSQKIGPILHRLHGNLTQHLGQHNLGITKSTRHEDPWPLVYSEGFDTRSEPVAKPAPFSQSSFPACTRRTNRGSDRGLSSASSTASRAAASTVRRRGCESS